MFPASVPSVHRLASFPPYEAFAFTLAMALPFRVNMKSMKLHLILLTGLWTHVSAAEELTKESMSEGVRASLAAYDVIPPPKADIPVTVRIKLGETTSTYRDRFIFDGFRITAPDDVADRDFIWFFNAPESWSNWFIIPVSGDFEGGFRNWLDADKLYSGLDKPQEKDRKRTLQTLDRSYFKPGAEYILWFRQVDPSATTHMDLRAVFRFATKPADKKKWDHDSIEEALQLKDAPDEDQVAQLESRGGRILLDTQFFNKADASSRIHGVLFSIRQTSHFDDGMFITMESSSPPCKTNPSLAAIREKYGPADFVVTSDEVAKVRKHVGDDPPNKDENNLITHYYDYFAFEVASGDQEEHIKQVTTHANDFSKLRPIGKEGHVGHVAMKNLTTFSKDQKEVGRLYYFLEADKLPLVITEPPVGRYQKDEGEFLEYQGDGKWLWLNITDDKVSRRVPFENHRMHGLAEGFNDDGQPTFKANYKDGVLHGEVREYNDEGKMVKRSYFRDGKPISDEERGVPRKGPNKGKSAEEPKSKPKPL